MKSKRKRVIKIKAKDVKDVLDFLGNIICSDPAPFVLFDVDSKKK